MATFLATMLLMTLVCATSQNSFGFPWMGGIGFDDLHGSGLRWRPSPFHDNGYDDYFGHWGQNPCPGYQAMRLSGWQKAADGQLMLKVFLPGVLQQDMHAWLSRGGSAIHIHGLRALASRARTCLPAEAKMSANGRYEILEASIPVPPLGDAQRASVRPQQGGLMISMPHRPRSQASDMGAEKMLVSERRDANPTSKGSVGVGSRQSGAVLTSQDAGHSQLPAKDAHEVTGSPSGMSPPMHSLVDANPTSKDTVGLGSRQSGAVPTGIPDEGHPQLPAKDAHKVARSPSVTLPPTDVLVEDADFPWPEKSIDAAAGWMDKRGEFQYY